MADESGFVILSPEGFIRKKINLKTFGLTGGICYSQYFRLKFCGAA